MELAVLSRERGVANLVGAGSERRKLQPPLSRIIANLATTGDSIAVTIADLERRSRLVKVLVEFGHEFSRRTGNDVVWTGAGRNELGMAENGHG